MSKKRIYVWSEEQKRLVPAWGENEEWGHARAAGTRGELVVGISQRTQDLMNERRSRERKAS